MDSEKTVRISVLMAIYNCSATLEDALASLVAQTYQGFRVILCDDCSTDNTYEVAQQYVSRFPEKFILLRNEQNLKLPATLNKCLEYADTEYVARMDGDDLSKPERFQKEIDFLDAHPEYALVSCPMDYFDENGVFMTGKSEGYAPDKYSFLKGSPFCHATIMMRTKILKELGGYTVARWTQRGQDFHLWGKLYGAGHIGYVLPAVLYQMRDDENAYKRRTFKERLFEIKRIVIVYQLVGLPKRYLYKTINPLLRAFAPTFVYNYFHRRRLSK